VPAPQLWDLPAFAVEESLIPARAREDERVVLWRRPERTPGSAVAPGTPEAARRPIPEAQRRRARTFFDGVANAVLSVLEVALLGLQNPFPDKLFRNRAPVSSSVQSR